AGQPQRLRRDGRSAVRPASAAQAYGRRRQAGPEIRRGIPGSRRGRHPMTGYEDILVEQADGVCTLTINRPAAGNKFRDRTALELADALRVFRSDRELAVAVITGAGAKFSCIGGEHGAVDGADYGNVMPIVDVYELIDTIAKPIIASVNGF